MTTGGTTALVGLFDLDGTLLDSDETLLRPFLELGVPREDVVFGLPLAEECDRLGVDLERYLEMYDATSAHPYPGVDDLVGKLERWGICSNKHPRSGRAELERLGWRPEATVFTAPGGPPKSLGPLIRTMDLHPAQVVYVGDTPQDRACATAAGVRFVLAAWNPRSERIAGEVVAAHPEDVAAILGLPH